MRYPMHTDMDTAGQCNQYPIEDTETRQHPLTIHMDIMDNIGETIENIPEAIVALRGSLVSLAQCLRISKIWPGGRGSLPVPR